MSVHEGIKYQCDLCVSKFTEKGYVRTHKMSVHVCVKYQCDQCESKFTDKGYLRIHRMSEHEGIKYQCESKFIEKRNLKKHKMALCT